MGFAEEIAERNRALLSMDMRYLRAVLPGTTDDVREAAAHKARYECTQLPREARHASAEWLRGRGMGRMDGTALLPEGELPEGYMPDNA